MSTDVDYDLARGPSNPHRRAFRLHPDETAYPTEPGHGPTRLDLQIQLGALHRELRDLRRIVGTDVERNKRQRELHTQEQLDEQVRYQRGIIANQHHRIVELEALVGEVTRVIAALTADRINFARRLDERGGITAAERTAFAEQGIIL